MLRFQLRQNTLLCSFMATKASWFLYRSRVKETNFDSCKEIGHEQQSPMSVRCFLWVSVTKLCFICGSIQGLKLALELHFKPPQNMAWIEFTCVLFSCCTAFLKSISKQSRYAKKPNCFGLAVWTKLKSSVTELFVTFYNTGWIASLLVWLGHLNEETQKNNVVFCIQPSCVIV